MRKNFKAPVAAILLRASMFAGLLSAGTALAEDPLGLYVGGAVGESSVAADSGGFSAGSFKANHSAFKAMLGLRPISLVGAEIEYVDFGHPDGAFGNRSGSVDMKGAAGFGVLYLPVPVIDVFLKLGLARVQSTAAGQTTIQPLCPANVPCSPSLFRLDRADTHVAEGVGVQFKLGPVAARGEYERFDAAGGNPGLWSLGLMYTF